ncbi:MAG: cupin domain-containing protein [Pseudomonadota bacterium]
MSNLFADIPTELDEELITVLLKLPGVRLERIVSRGQASPPGFWCDQDVGEWVAVLKGAARLEVEGRDEVKLGAGDHLYLPPHCRHRVTWTEPEQDTIWLALFVPEVGP